MTLLLVGILGFIADATFDTGSNIQGDSFLGFEVNGWHNLVHLASGLLLLAAANTRPSAKAVAIGFGFVYGIVALWGVIDGEQVLGVLPVNAADNILHVALSLLGIATGMLSPTTKREQLRKHEGRRGGRTVAQPAEDSDPHVRRDADAGRFDGPPGATAPEGEPGAEITRTRS